MNLKFINGRLQQELDNSAVASIIRPSLPKWVGLVDINNEEVFRVYVVVSQNCHDLRYSIIEGALNLTK